MIRAVITISGDVQGAGYRAYLMKIARKAGLTGYVENMPDGTVKVVCEGEKDLIERFVSEIKIKTEIVEVEDVKLGYFDATGDFKGKGFDIKVENSFRGVIRELFQGYVTSEKYFNKGFEKQDKMLEKQDQMLDKQDMMLEKQDSMVEKQDQMGGKQDKTIEVIDTRFDELDVKYGDISKTIGEVHNDLKEMKNLFEKLVNHFIEEK